ncbi:uncharacterized protein LOC122813331 [Protopterus annectens]|uniref:uncharacterized protein LOC122813331 n=1 Tax=Protopterus annectens TaxID=7888 RepID=UPI001CFA6715|nr:uncharacterized protein LOC122813331 [Protopterus annectens]
MEYSKIKYRPNLFRKENTILKELQANPDIRVMKPDKEGGVVIMDNITYKGKMNHILMDEVTYSSVSNNEVNIAYKRIDNVLEDLYMEGLIDEKTLRFLRVDKPRLPSIFKIPKTHENEKDPPLRPIVSAEESKTLPLAKYVDNKLKQLWVNRKAILKDSWDFLKEITPELFHDELTFITIDINNLFSSIPYREGMDLFEDILFEDTDLTHSEKLVCISLMELVLKYNFFFFKGEFYQQMQDVAMGAACAPTYANLVLAKWEEEYILNSEFATNWTVYKRFLDNIVIFWKGTGELFDEFLVYMKNTTKFLEFTYTLSRDCLQYLDVEIYKADGKFESRVFRKPTFCNSFLHYRSAHPPHCKRNIVKGQYVCGSRMTTSSYDFNKECGLLKEFFLERGYPLDLVGGGGLR